MLSISFAVSLSLFWYNSVLSTKSQEHKLNKADSVLTAPTTDNPRDKRNE